MLFTLLIGSCTMFVCVVMCWFLLLMCVRVVGCGVSLFIVVWFVCVRVLWFVCGVMWCIVCGGVVR